MTPEGDDEQRPGPLVPVSLDRLAAWSWRVLVIGGAVLALGYLIARLRLVLLPLGSALLLATALVPPTRWLARRGLRPLVATWVVVLAFLGTVVGAGLAIIPPFVDEFGDLGRTLEDARDEVEQWLIDGPVNLEPSTVEEWSERLEESVAGALTSDGVLLDSAVIVGEAIAGAVLTLVITFFLVKDGAALQRWALGHVPAARRERVRRIGTAAWSTLGRYLAGAAALGATEAVIIGATLALTGSSVVLPVAALTFLAAFVPFVGAIVAGTIAVVVSMVSSGPEAAGIVAIVAILVQQFDNEFLAPFVYSRALGLHPLVVILAITTGAAVGGILGAFIAVPVAAVIANVSIAASSRQLSEQPE